MTKCLATNSDVCSYLGTLGCDPGMGGLKERLSALETRVLQGDVTSGDCVEYLEINGKMEGNTVIEDMIFFSSCFFHRVSR